MNHRFLSYVLGIIIIGLLVMPQPSAAQEETEYVGLDVVFLIDQSGSMGGPEAGCTICTYANDPLGLRFAAPEFAIELLGDDLLQGQIARQTPVDVQVGIVSFGSTAQISLGPALIQATTEEEWIAEWNSSNYTPRNPAQRSKTPVLGLGMIMLRWASSEGMMANRVVSVRHFMVS